MIPARGEISLEIGEAAYPICLTLGALAEIEGVLACRSLADLSVKLGKLTGRDMQAVLCALLRGGGAKDADRIAFLASPNAAAVAVAQAFSEALR